jgi:hypothetical protein
MPLVDLRRGYNLTMWGTDVGTFSQAGDYVGPTEAELSGALGIVTEREILGIKKKFFWSLKYYLFYIFKKINQTMKVGYLNQMLMIQSTYVQKSDIPQD